MSISKLRRRDEEGFNDYSIISERDLDESEDSDEIYGTNAKYSHVSAPDVMLWDQDVNYGTQKKDDRVNQCVSEVNKDTASANYGKLGRSLGVGGFKLHRFFKKGEQ